MKVMECRKVATKRQQRSWISVKPSMHLNNSMLFSWFVVVFVMASVVFCGLCCSLFDLCCGLLLSLQYNTIQTQILL